MEIRDKKGEAEARTNLGAVLRSIGEYQKAKEYLQKALAIYMQIKDKEGEAIARTSQERCCIYSENFKRP